MSSNKKVPKPSKLTATPPDLAKALQELFAEKNPHLVNRPSQEIQAEKERAGLDDKDLH